MEIVAKEVLFLVTLFYLLKEILSELFAFFLSSQIDGLSSEARTQGCIFTWVLHTEHISSVSCTFCSFFMAFMHCYSISTRLAIATNIPQREYFSDFLDNAEKSLFSIHSAF